MVQIDPRVTMLDLLRERLHLTGAKKGCDYRYRRGSRQCDLPRHRKAHSRPLNHAGKLLTVA
jgi:hypothetical protein